MTITNGYATLQEVRDALFQARSLSASTIGFSSSGNTITDMGGNLARFLQGMIITVSGSAQAGNNRAFTVVTSSATALTVTETVTTSAAGSAVTITDTTHTEDDSMIESIVEAVSRLIDRYCRRRFYANGTDEKRYYTADRVCELWTDDIASITTLKTDDNADGTFETTWTASTDYQTWPYNASVNGEPVMRLDVPAWGSKSFPTHAKGVEIDGKFGYSSTTPPAIKRACIIQTVRLFKRRDAPFGITGAGEFGSVIEITDFDPDVKILLMQFQRVI